MLTPYAAVSDYSRHMLAALLLLTACGVQAQQFQQEYSAPRRASVEVLAMTNHTDRTYRIGETATVEVSALRNGLPVEGTVSYRVGDEMHMPDTWQQATFSSGQININLGTMATPGFRAVEWNFKVGGKTHKDLLKVAFEPEHIKTYAEMPADFSEFWSRAVSDARTVPLEVETWEVPSCTNAQVETRLIHLRVGRNKWMYGYLTRPLDGQQHPVVLCMPGAGSSKVTPSDYFPQRGYIYLKMEIHGNDPRLPDDEYDKLRHDMCDGYTRRGIEDRDTYYYKDVYAGAVRCMDYLCSLPDWDGRNAIVTGGSQGGALTIVTAALSRQVTALAAFYPALNDLTAFRHKRAGGWPKFFTTAYRDSDVSDMDEERVVKTLHYYDVTNFARTLTVPGFYSYGYNDDTCSPTSVCGMINEISAPKVVDVTPSSGHWRFADSQDRCMEWLETVMR